MDREKVIKELEEISDYFFDIYRNEKNGYSPAQEYCNAAEDAIALLKWQGEREKAICKGICDFIRGSCSTDTYEDKEYVCHVIQQMFIKGRSAK